MVSLQLYTKKLDSDLCVNFNKYKVSKEAKLFKNKLINEYKQIQYNVITKSNKLQICRIQIIKYEKYLNELSVDQRRAITKIRLSAHDLPIEKGRRQNIPRHKRYCNMCPAIRVGDEFHT